MAKTTFNAEYELESRFIKGLRNIFVKDEDFTYNENKSLSNLAITLDYPDNEEAPLSKPHLIVMNIALSDDAQNTFGNNFYRDVPHNGLVNGTQEYAFIIPYSVTIIASGDYSTSKDLASTVREYIVSSAYGYLSESLGLNITSVQKSPTSPSKQYPTKVFDTSITVQGTFYHISRKKPDGFMAGIDAPIRGIIINDINIKEY